MQKIKNSVETIVQTVESFTLTVIKEKDRVLSFNYSRVTEYIKRE